MFGRMYMLAYTPAGNSTRGLQLGPQSAYREQRRSSKRHTDNGLIYKCKENWS